MNLYVKPFLFRILQEKRVQISKIQTRKYKKFPRIKNPDHVVEPIRLGDISASFQDLKLKFLAGISVRIWSWTLLLTMTVHSNSTARILVFSLAFLLISTLQVNLSSAEKSDSISSSIKWSPARKSRFFETSPYHARTSGPSSQMAGIDPKNEDLYEEEKRLIHTGPNPLHN